MPQDLALFTVFLIFTGAAVMATVALFTRQTMLVAYILLGLVLGPAGFGLVEDSTGIAEISEIGIAFLLFLLGLDLSPVKLVKMLQETTAPTVMSCLVFAAIGLLFGYAIGLSTAEILVLTSALMFSSTIIGLKLLPTTVLHHKPTGETIISVLLLQDLIAIVVLVSIHAFAGSDSADARQILLRLLSLPLLVALIYVLQRYVILKLLRKFDKIKEYIFLLMIGWCIGIAQMTAWLGLSYEVGAFIAGVLLAANPIALYVADSLKPLRDFFLIVFFFSLGSSIELPALQAVLLPAALLAGLVLLIKPVAFRLLLTRAGEDRERAREVGVRLGQGSEFSLLITALAYELNLIGANAAHLIQVAMVITFMVSPYLIVMRYPTPIALSDRLRRD